MYLFSKIIKFQNFNKLLINKNPFLKNFSINMTRNALLLIANGSEEMEVVITADVLRRGGIDVTIASIDGSLTQPVKCSRNVQIVADQCLSAITGPYDVVILPGGLEGSNALAKSPEVGAILREQESANRLIAAICAAPIALKSHSIGLKKKITSHPSKAQELSGSYDYSEERVVIDGQLITSRGPGTAFEFALKIVEKLVGINKVNEITPSMILK